MDFHDEMNLLFRRIVEKNQLVRLLNNYRGFPISYEARIIGIKEGYLALSVHEYQAVCLALENKTSIHSNHLPSVLQANVISVDVLQKQAMLTEFIQTDNHIDKRNALRVQPRLPLDAEIYDGVLRIGGKIADISVNGVGIITFAAYIYGDLSYQVNKEVIVDFKLPTSPAILRLQGKVIHATNQHGAYLHRLGVKLQPNSEAEPALHDYINARQEEILRELRLIYISMCQERERQGNNRGIGLPTSS
jgi:hypothetical protein